MCRRRSTATIKQWLENFPRLNPKPNKCKSTVNTAHITKKNIQYITRRNAPRIQNNKNNANKSLLLTWYGIHKYVDKTSLSYQTAESHVTRIRHLCKSPNLNGLKNFVRTLPVSNNKRYIITVIDRLTPAFIKTRHQQNVNNAQAQQPTTSKQRIELRAPVEQQHPWINLVYRHNILFWLFYIQFNTFFLSKGESIVGVLHIHL